MRETKTLPVDAIRIDGGTQTRVEIDEPTVDDYAQEMADGAAFPPVDVFHDGSDYWLACGFHRWHATRKAGRTEILATVHDGTVSDARRFAIGNNTAHGKRRTNADKRREVEMALLEWPEDSYELIAKKAGVSSPTVAAVRATLKLLESTTRVGADGRTIDTRNIGRKPAPEAFRPGHAEPGDVLPGFDDDPLPPGEEVLDEAERAIPEPTPIRGPEREPGDDTEAIAEDEASPAVAEPERTDEKGTLLPDRLLPAFDLVPDFRKLCRLIDEASAEAERLAKTPAGAHLHYQSVQSHLSNAKNGVWMRRPYAVCPYCKAAKPKCDGCRGCGWVTKSSYAATPPELRGADE